MILGHVQRRSPIVVHGDYDCDGVSSTAILVRTLRDLDAQVSWSCRAGPRTGTAQRRDGRALADEGAALLVTVDCGVTAVDEVARARELGLDVV